MKKLVALLLLAAMLSAVSCAEKAANETQITSSGATEAETETELSDKLPDYDGDGYTFRVLTISESIGIEEEDGETLNDAEYKRDVKVEDRFNIDITAEFFEDYSKVTSQFKTAVTAGEDAYDMVFIHMVDGATLASSGVYYPINNLEYINLDQIWWDDQIQNGFSVGGKLFLAAGDILPETLLRTSCMAFNKDLFDEYTMTYPYQLAYDGEWTLDELAALTKDATHDVDGDGKITESKDFFGLTSWYLDSPYSLYYGAGGTIIAKDEDDIPYLNLDVEKNLAIYMKMYEVIVTNNSNYHTDIGSYYDAYTLFVNGNALFCEIALSHLTADDWRAMEQDYGLVPIPKYDADQENYLSFVNGAAAMMGVPITITDSERTSIIIEGLASESYKNVTPTLYEVVAKTKHTRDEESSDMIDIIIRERVFDFGYTHLYGNSITSFHRDLLKKGSTDVASVFAKNESALERSLDKLIEAYEENT